MRDGTIFFDVTTQRVYDYIRYYWKKEPEQLETQPFDLEELFTLLQLQMSDSIQAGDDDRYRKVALVYEDVINWLTLYLALFDTTEAYTSPFMEFGRILWNEPATTITFNYDCMLEYVLANASGVNRSPIPDHKDLTSDAAMTYSHYNWNPALCYGIPFDEVQPFRAGVARSIPGKAFYGHPVNKLYATPILKLHGSLNWLRYVPVRAYPLYSNDDSPPPTGSILVKRPNDSPTGQIHNGWMTERELIPPVLYKQAALKSDKFELLWQRAFDELAHCRRLVVVGYSFPATDFTTKRLFLEAFADRPPLDELTMVNKDTTRLPIIRELTHHKGPIRSMNTLEDFVGQFA